MNIKALYPPPKGMTITQRDTGQLVTRTVIALALVVDDMGDTLDHEVIPMIAVDGRIVPAHMGHSPDADGHWIQGIEINGEPVNHWHEDD